MPINVNTNANSDQNIDDRVRGSEEYSLQKTPSMATNKTFRPVPWESSTRFVRPFVIRVSPERTFCVLCNCSIPNHAGYIESHETGVRHSYAMDDYGFDISLLENGRFHCRPCDREIGHSQAILPHVRQDNHCRARHRSDRAHLSQPSSWDDFTCPFVKEIGLKHFYCIICNHEAFNQDEFLSHASGKSHINAVVLDKLHVQPLRDDFFHCQLCDVVLPRADTVRVHISGKRHHNALSIDWTQQPGFVAPFVRSRFESAYYCLLCNCTFERCDAALEDHRNQENHVEMEKLEGEHLLPLQHGRYACTLCQCFIYSWERVRIHLGGVKHQRALIKGHEHNRDKASASWHPGGHDKNQLDEKASQSPMLMNNRLQHLCNTSGKNDDSSLRSNEKKRAVAKSWNFNRKRQCSSMVRELKKFDKTSLNFCVNGNRVHCQEGEIEMMENEKRSNEICERWQIPNIQDGQEGPKGIREKAYKIHERSENMLERPKEIQDEPKEILGRPKQIMEKPQVIHKSLNRKRENFDELRRDTNEMQMAPKESEEKQIEFQRKQKEHQECQKLQKESGELKVLQEKEEESQQKQEDLQEKQKELQKKPQELQEKTQHLQKTPAQFQKKLKEFQEPLELREVSNETQETPKDLKQSCSVSPLIKNEYQSSSSPIYHETEYLQMFDPATILFLMNEELATLLEELRLRDATKIENALTGSETKDKSTSQLPSGKSVFARIKNLQTLIRSLSSKTISTNKLVQSSEPEEIEFVQNCIEDLSARTSTSLEECSSRKPRNAYLEKVLTLLTFEEDIYDTSAMMRTTLLSFDLRIPINSSTDYCMVCHKPMANDLQKCIDHSCDRAHLESIRNMEKEDSEIRNVPDELSELSSAREFVEVSRDVAKCLVCHVTLGICDDLKDHIVEKEHCVARDWTRAQSRKNYELVISRLHCDWYRVQKYECLVCLIKFDTEIDFVDHLIESDEHRQQLSTNDETRVYVFCAVCALLYCAHASAQINHHETLAHKWFVRNGPFIIDRLPVAAELLLSSYEDYEDFKMAELMEEIESSCRSSVMEAHDRGTGYDFDSNYNIEPPLENVKFIRFFDKIFPPGAKILSFLKLWLTGCDLAGVQGISSIALYWYFVLYLQTLSILPSVASLTSMKAFWHNLADWEDISRFEMKGANDLKEHLLGFFALYANFDYRYDVACPLLGKVIEKRAFANDVRYLPEEMRSYVIYMTYHEHPEPFRIDACMCLQDPLDLHNNLTKSVTKVDLSRFRIFCSKSLSLLFAM